MARLLSCRVRIGAALLMLVATSAAADINVRPQFSVAASMPAHWGVIDHGKALGLAVEVETSPRWSQIAEFDVHWLDANGHNSWSSSSPFVGPPVIFGPETWSEALLMSGRFGLRFHLVETA